MTGGLTVEEIFQAAGMFTRQQLEGGLKQGALANAMMDAQGGAMINGEADGQENALTQTVA